MNRRLPLCLVLMPIGRRPGLDGTLIDFDAVYDLLIAPALEQAGLEPLRAAAERADGAIHKPTLERLILCEYAIVDLTIATANVFYELGWRHGVRAHGTVPVVAESAASLPFDLNVLQALAYRLGVDGKPIRTQFDRTALACRLKAASEPASHTPVYRMVDDFPDIQRLKTDVFRDRVDYPREIGNRLRDARRRGTEAVHAVGNELTAVPGWGADTQAAVLVDLYLSYRAVKDWPAMIALAAGMPPPLAATTLVQEQLGFALNRSGRPDAAEAILKAVIERHGASSETCAILGRVYKDRWDAAVRAGETSAADGWLVKAIEAYLEGFEADWRDAYPGINAVTLMELKVPPDPRRTRLIPVVAYAAQRRIAGGQDDYWDHATRLEVAVLGRDEEVAADALKIALTKVREKWEPETTARNLRLIRQCRDQRGEPLVWAAALEHELDRRAA